MGRRPIFILILTGLAALALACSGSGTGPAAPRIPLDAVSGSWSVVTGGDSCVAAPIVFNLAAAPDSVLPFGTVSFTTAWSAGTLSGPLYGSVNLATRVVALRFYSADFGAGAAFDGSVSPTSAMTGRLTDPYADFVPLFTADSSCAASAQGSRSAGQ